MPTQLEGGIDLDTMQIILLSIAGLIILFVVVNAIIRLFKNRSNVSDHYEIENPDEENFPNIQSNEPEAAEEVLSTKLESAKTDNVEKEKIDNAAAHDHFMMISVHSKPNTVFSDYSFLQSMGSAGLEYGDHKIFHYDVKTDIGIQRLFSVAQLNKPGTFDIDHVETIHCKGLLMFIDLRACRKQTLALDCMLEAAYQLAEDLDGIMFEGYNTPWHDDTPRALAQQLEQYQKKNKNIFNEIPCE